MRQNVYDVIGLRIHTDIKRVFRWVLFSTLMLGTVSVWALDDAVTLQMTAEELQQLKTEADKGDPRSEYMVGMIFRANGDGAAIAEAVSWIRKSAEHGYAPAQNTLGMFYARGIGVEQNSKTAFEWVKKAADQTLLEAQYNLGLMYLTGDGVAQDNTQGMAWVRKAAERGWPEASVVMGDLARLGQGMTADPEQASAWYRKAAELGSPEGMYRHGQLMRENPAKRKEAGNWIQKAAESGFHEAQFIWGVILYEEGGEQSPDLVGVYQWFSLAAQTPDRELRDLANSIVTDLKKEMTAQQITEGDTRNKEWKPKSYLNKK